MIRTMNKMRKALFYKYEGLLFIAPWIIGFCVFVCFPLLYSLFMSFQRVQITAGGVQHVYVGLQYYRSILFEEGGFLYDALIPFFQEALLMIPIILIFSLLIAIMLNQRFFGRGFFRALFFLPVIFASGNVITKFIDQGRGQLGFVEQFSLAATITQYLPVSWTAPIMTVLDSFVLILWYSGVQILIFLAGRQTISPAVYEAGRIDGANPWESFWKITLPAMTPFILLNLIYTIVELFTYPGNPVIANVTTQNYGHSSALAWIYFSIILLFLMIVFYFFARVNRSATSRR